MSKLFASAAMRRITPTDDLRAKWNKKAPKPFSAPHNDVFVQSIVFSDKEGHALIHLAGEIIMTYGPEIRDAICKEYNVPQSCVFLSCTHNHMLPGLLSPGQPESAGGGFGGGEGSRQWTDFVNDQALAAVREAMATLRPARLGAGHGHSGLSVNREWDTPVGSLGTGDRNGDTLHEISVLRVDELDGKPIAVLVNSNCHAGSFYGGSVGLDHRIVGGDVAGFVREFVGNAIGNGVVSIWAIGGAGDQNTYFHSGMMWPSVDEKGQFFQETYVMQDDDAIKLARNAGAIQAIEAMNVYRNITEFSEHFDLKTGIVYKSVTRRKESRGPGGGPGGPGGPGGRLGGQAVSGSVGPGSPTTASLSPVPAVRQAGPVQYEEATFRFYLITLNGIAFAGANTESFIGLKKAVRGILPFDEKFFIDMNFDQKSGHAGYVPAPRYDSFYDQGKRDGLQGNLLPYNGNDVLRLFCDGFDELVKTIA